MMEGIEVFGDLLLAWIRHKAFLRLVSPITGEGRFNRRLGWIGVGHGDSLGSRNTGEASEVEEMAKATIITAGHGAERKCLDEC
jgi:hypothetical protein